MAHGTLENLSRSSFVRTPPSLASRLFTTIFAFPEPQQRHGREVVAVLDPAAGEGDLLLPLVDLPYPELITCTGIEISTERALIARTRLSSLTSIVLPSACEGIRLPKAGVSLVLLNPPYFLVNGKRAEYTFVLRSTEALVPGGILAAILPARSAWKFNLVTFLTRWYDDLQVWKAPSKEEGEEESPFELYTQIFVVGRKRVAPRDPDLEQIQALLGYAWRKVTASGEEGWAGSVPPPTLPITPVAEPYQIPFVSRAPLFTIQNASESMLLEALTGNDLGQSGIGADNSVAWKQATTWQEDAVQRHPVMPYTGAAHVAAEIMTGLLGGEVILLDGRCYLLTAFVGSTWAKVRLDEEAKQHLRSKGVVRASMEQSQDDPVLGVLDLERSETTYYEGQSVFAFLSPWIAPLAAYAQRKRPPLYRLQPDEWELRVLTQIGCDKQLPSAPYPGLTPAQMHRICAMGRALDERGLVALQGEPGTGKTRLATATAARQAYLWRHRHEQRFEKQPAWIRGLRRAWLKNAHTMAWLDLEPVSGERLPQQQGQAQIRVDASIDQVVAYRSRRTGVVMVPEEVGPRALPVLVATPKKVTKEYEKEIRAAWPEAETMLIQQFADIPRWLQQCAVSEAPAVVAICSHSQSQPRGSGRIWKPALMEWQKPLRRSQMQEMQKERTLYFRCPDCFGLIQSAVGVMEETSVSSPEDVERLHQEAEEQVSALLMPVTSRVWFEKKPRWCACAHRKHQRQQRRPGQRRTPLWTETRVATTQARYPSLTYGEWSRVMDHLTQLSKERGISLSTLCAQWSEPEPTKRAKHPSSEMPHWVSRITPVSNDLAPIHVPSQRYAGVTNTYDLMPQPPDSFGVYEYLERFFHGCVALTIVDESHNGRGQNSDIARALHRAMRAAQSRVLTSGTHFGGDILSFYFYWYRFHPQFWKQFGLSWRHAQEALHRYGVIQLWKKEYESQALKGGGKTEVSLSTVPAPGVSATLIPYLLEDLAFLTVLDVGSYMPPKIERPEIVDMRDPLVEAKEQEARTIVAVAQQTIKQLEQEKKALFEAVRDKVVEPEALQEFSLREEEAHRALERAQQEQKRLLTWVRAHDLRGAYLDIVRSLAFQARQRNPTARMAQGTIPRWFAVLPCDKPFQLWQTKRGMWGEEESQACILTTPQLDWDYLYPLEKRLLALVQAELEEGRRVMVYIDQSQERSMPRRLQWVLQQAGITSWSLPDRVKPEDRQQAIIDAMRPCSDEQPGVQVVIVSYLKVNEGINLQSVVDSIIWFEMALNLFMLEQASRRAWRLGKKEEVRIYYLAYAGTAGHQKMRKLGGQSGAAAAFAGEPARGALIEESGADKTTLARFSETVEAEFVGEDEEEDDPLRLFEMANDQQELAEVFARRATEEQEALRRGRMWFGAEDTLPQQVEAIWSDPQRRRPVWGEPFVFRTVYCVEGTIEEQQSVQEASPEHVLTEPMTCDEVESFQEEVVVLPEHGAKAMALVPDVISPGENVTGNLVPERQIVPPEENAHEPQQTDGEKKQKKRSRTLSAQQTGGRDLLEVRSEKKPAKQVQMVPDQAHQVQEIRQGPGGSVHSVSQWIFGNVEHILQARQRRTAKRTQTVKIPKKPCIQVEVRDIPAVEPEAEASKPRRVARKQPEPVKVRTLWDFAEEQVQEPALNPSEEKPKMVSVFQQTTLW